MDAMHLQQVRHAYREGGTRLVARKIGWTVYCDVLLYSFDLGRVLPRVGSEMPLEVRPLLPAEVEAYLALRPEEDPDVVHARLRRGDVCFSSWAGDRIAGCAWIRFDRMWVSEIGKSVLLRPGEAYGYDSYTTPGHRGRGAANARIEAVLRHVQSLGYERLVAYVMGDNTAGLAAVASGGFEPDGSIRWLHVGRHGLTLTRGRAGWPRLGVHIRPHNTHG